MARSQKWTWLLTTPMLIFVGCGGGSDSQPRETVIVTVQARYEKQSVTSTGFGPITSQPARYALAKLYDNATNAELKSIDLDANGTGTATVIRGTNIFAVIYADILVPMPVGTGFTVHGNVKKAIPKAHYLTGAELENDPTWATTSDTFQANSSGNLTVLALKSTSEAGAFAIADQMVEFGLGMGRLEPTLPLPNLHVFWTSGTGSTNPTAATTASTSTSVGTILNNPNTNRPMLVNEVWYGGPSNCADAYNGGLLVDTFSRGLSAYGSYWHTSSGQTQYGSIVRSDNDAASISPWISSESTIAFTSGFSAFLSAALRNDPNVYLMNSGGVVDSWSLAVHDATPTGGGEFYSSSIARAQWGIWKTALGGTTTGLQTIWNATNPTQAPNDLEFGNAPLACYPTYLKGLKRLAGTPVSSSIQTQLELENVGNGMDVTLGSYFDSTALWTSIIPGGAPINGSLVTYDNNLAGFENAYYDRVEAKAYRVPFSAGTHTFSISTTSPGLILEVFDSIGVLLYAYPTSIAPASKSINLSAGTYAVRVRVDPYKIYNGASANYTLSVN